jgi:TfoX/Sxy family transcriptional regulator of competence genes
LGIFSSSEWVVWGWELTALFCRSQVPPTFVNKELHSINTSWRIRKRLWQHFQCWEGC